MLNGYINPNTGGFVVTSTYTTLTSDTTSISTIHKAKESAKEQCEASDEKYSQSTVTCTIKQ